MSAPSSMVGEPRRRAIRPGSRAAFWNANSNQLKVSFALKRATEHPQPLRCEKVSPVSMFGVTEIEVTLSVTYELSAVPITFPDASTVVTRTRHTPKDTPQLTGITCYLPSGRRSWRPIDKCCDLELCV